MAYVFYNPNPQGHRVDDYSVRAVAKVLDKDWEDAYMGLCSEGLVYSDMPTSGYVIGMYLRRYGFTQKNIPSVCPKCTTVSQFTDEHHKGTYVLVCHEHIVASIAGSFFDTWDSGDEIVLYYFEKEFD